MATTEFPFKKLHPFTQSNPKKGLRWLLEFGNWPVADFYPPHSENEQSPPPAPSLQAAVQSGIARFLYAVRPVDRFARRASKPLTGAEVQKLYSIVRCGLAEIAEGGIWNLRRDQLSLNFTIGAGAGWSINDGDYCDQFLLTCIDLMTREGNLIAKCAREDCGILIMRSRRARYCSKACSRLMEAHQARNRRQETSREERTRIRRSYYLARLRRQDLAHWRHLSDAAESVAKAIQGLNKAGRESE
jgi:hypothetical protein